MRRLELERDRLAAALDASRAKGLPRYEVLQPEYNLYDRAAFEGPLRDLCVGQQIGVVTYYSLAKGFLSGKYRGEADLPKSPRGGGVKRYFDARGWRILAALDEVAARRSTTPAAVALAWIVAQPGVSAPIASATAPAQLESLVAAASLTLSAEDVAALDSAGAP